MERLEAHNKSGQEQKGISTEFEIADPGIVTDDSTEYIASYTIKV